MLDVVRLTRALRPDGIEWPMDANGQPTNRLELITKANGIAHDNAHDAFADVAALIEVTKLVKRAQPQLFDYLLAMRDKRAVQRLVNLETKQPFVYTSGRYDKQHAKTTVAFPLAPTPFVNLSQQELAKKIFATWEERQADDFVALPVKPLQYNRCPAVAPLGVLEQGDGWSKIHLEAATVARHRDILLRHPDFAEKLRTLYEKKREYIAAVRSADAKALADFHPAFRDERLPELLLHSKASSFPQSLSDDEQAQWEQWRSTHLQAQLPSFMASLQRLAKAGTADEFIMQELQLWLEAVMPVGE